MKKITRILCAALASLIVLSHFCVFAGVSNGEAVVVIDSVSGLPGQTVEVNVNLNKNPGITGLLFRISYDKSKLTLTKAEYTKLGGGGLTAVKIENNPVVLLWNVSLYEFTETGILAKLTFKINEGASVGDVPLKATWNRGDCIDYDLKDLTIDMTHGNVHVGYDGTNCEHKSKTTKVTKQPTCTEGGLFEVKCDTCSTVLSSGDLAREEHTYGQLIVTKEPTYTEIGLKEQKCSKCGDVRTEPIEPLDPPETEDTEPENTAAAPPDTEVDTDEITNTVTPAQTEAMPIETAPATGDDTVIYAAVCTVSLLAVILLTGIKRRKVE